MDTKSLTISVPARAFVEDQAGNGGYRSAAGYVHALIREARKRCAQEKLEALLLDGLQSGKPIEITEEYWKEKHRKVSARRKVRRA